MIGAFAGILLATIALPGLKLKKDKISSEITLLTSKRLKGLLSIIIFFNHFTGWFLKMDAVMYLLVHCGSQVVAIFFFLSSYGLSKKYSEKEMKFRDFIKRGIKLLLPYWICEIIYCVVSTGANIPIKVAVNFKNIVVASLGLVQKSEIVENGWFVTAIGFMYICWFVLSKILKKIKMSYKLTALIVIFLIITRGKWISSIMAFPLGVYIAENENKERKVELKKWKFIILTVLLGLFGSLKFIGQYINKECLMNFSDLTTSIIFAVIIYGLLTYVNFGNDILDFLGGISYEIYLIHGLCIRISYKIWGLEKSLLFCITAIVLSAAISYAVNRIVKLLNGAIFNKR